MVKPKEKLLIPRDKYLSAGVHIGMTTKTANMKRFIYNVRPSGLAVLDISTLDERIDIISNSLAKQEKILIVSKKETGFKAVKKFAETIGGKSIIGRFMPGSLTNPSYRSFFEPEVIITTDPLADKQAITEAVNMRIPIVSLTDTFNETDFIDFVLPCNNKGKKSIALVYWLLAKTIMGKRDKKFDLTPEDFGYE